MHKTSIKCSQCEKEFAHGYNYRLHWEKEHLEKAIKKYVK